MKITILAPKSEFTKIQQEQLSKLGKVVYTESRKEYPIDKLIQLTKDSQILAADPDNLGGFEKAAEGRLTQLMDSLPNLKGVALSTTSFSWIDLDYCRKRKIIVTNVPYYSTETMAEQVIALLFCLARKTILTDRRTQKGKYQLEMGFELKGKTLGIIGLGHIGSRVAELGNAIGMKVIAFNRTPKKTKYVEIKSLDGVLAESDAISINLASNKETKNLINKERLARTKNGVVIVNLAMREIVDENAMAEALKSGKVSSYTYEGEDLDSTPLAKIETAIGLKGFSWYTKEALANDMEIWINCITSIARGKPINKVS